MCTGGGKLAIRQGQNYWRLQAHGLAGMEMWRVEKFCMDTLVVAPNSILIHSIKDADSGY